MIFCKLRLHPFAGIPDKTIDLQPGLNVLLGENDIGKSTTFKAIEAVLFTPIALKQNTKEGKQFKETCFPIGGDHASVTLNFERDGKKYQLEKTWGPQSSSRLTRPDGSSITSAETIDRELASLFPVPEGSFRALLLSRQGDLVHTIRELSESTETLNSLGDILRAAMNQIGGVSVERLKELLRERSTATFENWDDTIQRPAGHRGIENPWRTQGTILKACYEKETLQKKWVEVDAMEKRLADTSHMLGVKKKQLKEYNDFISTNVSIIDADRKRQVLANQLIQAQTKVDSIGRDFGAWHKAEIEVVNLRAEVEKTQIDIRNLTEELAVATQKNNASILLTKVAQIKKKQEELLQAQNTLANLKVITPKDVELIQQSEQQLAKLRAGLEGGRLRVELTAKRMLTALLTSGIEPATEHVLAESETFKIDAAGRIRIETDELSLAVTAGDGDFAAQEQKIHDEEQKVTEFLTRFQVASSGVASAEAARYQQAENAALRIQAEIKAILGNETMESLTEKTQSFEGCAASRPNQTIQADQLERSRIMGERQSALTQTEKVLADLKVKYATDKSQDLVQQMTAQELHKTQIKSQMEALPPLPPEITDPAAHEAFLKKFEMAQRSLPSLNEEIRKLSEEKGSFVFPDASAQDLARQQRLAEENFERELKTGKALQRIDAAIKALDAEGTNIYSSLQNEFDQLVNRVTRGKYTKTTLDGALPSHFLRKDGVNIPFALLSSGIKDGVALSLRLSMAKHFLGKSGGVILMDDPLVSMDTPKRMEAGKIISEWGSQTQILIFTCHDAHAELLGGNRISF